MKNKKVKFAKSDYQYSSLPNTRKDAFKDVYKHNFLTIMKCGVVLLLFALPVLGFSVFMDVGRLGMTLEYYSEEDLVGVLLLWNIFRTAGIIFLTPLIVLGVSGVMRVLKLVVFQEGVDFFYDFKVGIKENFVRMLTFYLFYILIYVITYYLQLFFLDRYIGLVILLLFFFLFTPVLCWSFVTIVVYQTKLWDYCKNSFFFFVKTVGFSLLFTLIIVWPLLLSLLVSDNLISIGISPLYIVIKNFVLIVMLLFYYPCSIILSLLYGFSKFDKYINQDNYPEIYRKGLYAPKNK